MKIIDRIEELEKRVISNDTAVWVILSNLLEQLRKGGYIEKIHLNAKYDPLQTKLRGVVDEDRRNNQD